MSPDAHFGIEPKQPLASELERVAREQLAVVRWNLREAMERPPGDPANLAEPIHDARKSLKKLRAFARFVRFHIGSAAYQRNNALLRDAARLLSGGRDAYVVFDLFLKLADDLTHSSFERLSRFRDGLEASGKEQSEALRSEGHLRNADVMLAHVETDVLSLVPEKPDLDLLLRGVREAYGDCRQAMLVAGRMGRDDLFHEWRKTVKYVRHHVELLQPAAPELLGAIEQLGHDLADRLGDHNDLSVLAEQTREVLDHHEREDSNAMAFQELLDLISDRQAGLRGQALDLGRQLLAEKPGRYVKRLRMFWKSANQPKTALVSHEP